MTAALLEHSPLPDHSGMTNEELLDRLAVLLADRAESAVEGVAIVGALRARQVKFEVIRDRAGLSLGRAHRWNGLYQSISTQPTTEGAARA